MRAAVHPELPGGTAATTLDAVSSDDQQTPLLRTQHGHGWSPEPIFIGDLD